MIKKEYDMNNPMKASMDTSRKKQIPSSHESDIDQGHNFLKSILITGGVGFLGSHVTEALLREGRKVVIFDAFNAETSRSLEKKETAEYLIKLTESLQNMNCRNGSNPSLKIITGDIRDKEHLLKVIADEEITASVHLGGMVDDRRSVLFPDEYIDINIRGTATLLDALGKSGVRMHVQASTRSVFGERDNDESDSNNLDENAPRRPVNPYGATKVGTDAFAHVYSHLYSMNVTLIRISSAYGPRGRPDMIPRILIESVEDGKPIRKFGDGTATRTWIYVSDIVRAFILALKKPQNGYAEFNIASNSTTTLNDVIRIAEEVTGKKAIIENVPAPPGDANKIGHLDCSKIERVLGWRANIGVREGFKMLRDDYLVRKGKRIRSTS